MDSPLQDLSAEQKLDVLKTLLLENNKELVFWRERNWRVLRDSIAGLIAISSVSIFKAPENWFVATVLVVLSLSVAALANIYLVKNFGSYTRKLLIRFQVEQALGCFQLGRYLDGQSLFPQALQNPKPDKRGTYSFIAAIWAVAIVISVTVTLIATTG